MADHSGTHAFDAEECDKETENQEAADPFTEQTTEDFPTFPDFSDLSALDTGAEFWSPWSPGADPVPEENTSKPLVGDLFSSLAPPNVEETSCAGAPENVSEDVEQTADEIGEEDFEGQSQSLAADVEHATQETHEQIAEQNKTKMGEEQMMEKGLEQDVENDEENKNQKAPEEMTAEQNKAETSEEQIMKANLEQTAERLAEQSQSSLPDEKETTQKVSEQIVEQNKTTTQGEQVMVESLTRTAEHVANENLSSVPDMEHTIQEAQVQMVEQNKTKVQGEEIMMESLESTAEHVAGESQSSVPDVEHTIQEAPVRMVEKQNQAVTYVEQNETKSVEERAAKKDPESAMDNQDEFSSPDVEQTVKDVPGQTKSDQEETNTPEVKVMNESHEAEMGNQCGLSTPDADQNGKDDPGQTSTNQNGSKAEDTTSKEQVVECIDLSSDEEAAPAGVGCKAQTSTPQLLRNVQKNSASGVERVIGTSSLDEGGEKLDMQEVQAGSHNVTVFFVKKDNDKPIKVDNKGTNLSTADNGKKEQNLSTTDERKSDLTALSSKGGTKDGSDTVVGDGAGGKQSKSLVLAEQGVGKQPKVGSGVEALTKTNHPGQSLSSDDDIIIDEVVKAPKKTLPKTSASVSLPHTPKQSPKFISSLLGGSLPVKSDQDVKEIRFLSKPRPRGRPRKSGEKSRYIVNKERQQRQGQKEDAVENSDAGTGLALDVESHPDEAMQSIVDSIGARPSVSDVDGTSTANAASEDVIMVDASGDEDQGEEQNMSEASADDSQQEEKEDESQTEGDDDDTTWGERTKSKQNWPKSLTCAFCSKTFNGETGLNRHLVTHYDLKPFKCRICGAKFSDSSTHVRHLRGKHKTVVDRSKDYLCSHCDQNCLGPSALLKHVMSHVRKDAIPQPNFRQRNNVATEKIKPKSLKKNEKKKSKAQKVGRKPVPVLKTGAQGDALADDSDGNEAEEEQCPVALDDLPECSKMFDCPQCDISCTDTAYYIEHVKTQHSSHIQLQCPMCSTVFIKIASFLSHLRIQNCVKTNSKLLCSQCEFEGTDSTDLAEHVMNIHTLCHVCKKEFRKLEILQRHLTSHLQIKPFRCSQCKAEYKDASSFKQHMQVNHQVANITYECYRCKTFFSGPTELTRHFFNHVTLEDFEVESAKYNCVRCNSWYKDTETLRAHTKLCEVKAIYRCDRCPHQCNDLQSLKVHSDLCKKSAVEVIKAKTLAPEPVKGGTVPGTAMHVSNIRNPVNMLPAVSRTMISSSSTTPKKTNKVFRCTKCNFISSDTNEHVQHVISKHNAKNIQYQCHVCKLLFTSPAELVTHIDSHNKSANKAPSTVVAKATTKLDSAGNPVIAMLTSASPIKSSTPGQGIQQQQLQGASSVLKSLTSLVQKGTQSHPNPVSVGASQEVDYSKMPALGTITKLSQMASAKQLASSALRTTTPVAPVSGIAVSSIAPSTVASTGGTAVVRSPAKVTQPIISNVTVPYSQQSNKQMLVIRGNNAQSQPNKAYTVVVPAPVVLPSSQPGVSMQQRTLTLPPIMAPTGSNIKLHIFPGPSQSTSGTTTTVTQANLGGVTRTGVLVAAPNSADTANRSTQQAQVSTLNQPNNCTGDTPQPSTSGNTEPTTKEPSSASDDSDSDSSDEDRRFVMIKQEPKSDDEDMTKRDIYKCDICQTEFVQASALLNHQVLLHGDGAASQVGDDEASSSQASQLNESSKNDSGSEQEDLGFHYVVSDSEDEITDSASETQKLAEKDKKSRQKNRSTDPRQCHYEGCNKIFYGYSNLFRHIFIHTDVKPFQCHKCEAKYADTSAYVKHRKQAHQLYETKFSCQYCKVGNMPNQKALMQHLNTHSEFHDQSQFYRCFHCACFTRSIAALQNHIQTTHDKFGLHHCYFCKASVDQSVKLSLHLHENHLPKLPFQCKRCKFKTSQVGLYDSHMLKDHKVKTVQYTCPACDQVYNTSKHLLQHELTHSGGTISVQLACEEFSKLSPGVTKTVEVTQKKISDHKAPSVEEHHEHSKHKKKKKKKKKSSSSSKEPIAPLCNLCNAEFPSTEGLHRHLWHHNSNKPYKCYKCSMEFVDSASYTQHIKTLHKSRMMYVCFMCKKTYTLASDLLEHYTAKHYMELIKCTECNHSFVSLDQLNTHFKSHSAKESKTEPASHLKSEDVKEHKAEVATSEDEVPPECRFCQKQFPKQHQIKRHEKIHFKPFVCSVKWCLKRFGENVPLVIHKERTHKGRCCDYCVSSFRTLKELTEHQKIHKNQSQSYSCVYCTRSFTNFDDFVMHTDIALDKFTDMTCYVCKEKLTLPCQMLVHQEIHQAKKPCRIKCNFCGTVCRNIIDFNKHRKDRHGVKSLLDIEESSKDVDDSSTGEKECHFCYRVCKTPRRMKIHLKQDHAVNEYLAVCMTKTMWKNVDSAKLEGDLGKVPEIPASFQMTGDYYDEDEDEDEEPSGGGLTCKFCSAKFTDVKLLRDHEAAHSESMGQPFPATASSGAHECKFCGFTFVTEKELKEHEHVHTTRSKEESKNTPEGIEDIPKKSTETSVEGGDEKKEENVEDDVFDDDGGGDLMDFEEESDESDKEDEKKVSKEQQMEGHKKLACPFCDVKSSSKQNLMKHIMSHAGQEVKHGGKLNVKVQMSFKCDRCSASFKYREMLKKHKRKHFNEGNEEGLIYKCSFCAKEFNHIAKYYRHKMAAHAKKDGVQKRPVGRPRKYPKKPEKIMENTAGENITACDDNSKPGTVGDRKSIQTESNLLHFKYSCDGCGGKFRKKKRWNEHQIRCPMSVIKSQDAEPTPDKLEGVVPSLDKKPARPSGYIGISSSSSIARGWIYPHKCVQCSALFRKKRALDRHMLHMHDRSKKPPGRISQILSGAIQPRSSRDKIKKVKKHDESVKKWKCVACGERFFREVSLLRHLPMHKEKLEQELNKEISKAKKSPLKVEQELSKEVPSTSQAESDALSTKHGVNEESSGDSSSKQTMKEPELTWNPSAHDEVKVQLHEEVKVQLNPISVPSPMIRSVNIGEEESQSSQDDVLTSLKHEMSQSDDESMRSTCTDESFRSTDDKDKLPDGIAGLSNPGQSSADPPVWIYPYYCKFCQAPFAKHSVYRKHLRKHTRKKRSKGEHSGPRTNNLEAKEEVGCVDEISNASTIEESTDGRLSERPAKSKEDQADEVLQSQEDQQDEVPMSQKDKPDEEPQSQEDQPDEVPQSQEDQASPKISDVPAKAGLEDDSEDHTVCRRLRELPGRSINEGGSNLSPLSERPVAEDTEESDKQGLTLSPKRPAAEMTQQSDEVSLTPSSKRPAVEVAPDSDRHSLSPSLERLAAAEVTPESKENLTPSSKRPAVEVVPESDIHSLSPSFERPPPAAVVTPKSDEQRHEGTSSMPDVSYSNENDGVSPCKRPRGRPRKVSNESRVSSPLLEPPRTKVSTDTHISSSSTQGIVEDYVKRGRGRPRKVSNEYRVSSPVLEPPRTEESTDMHIASTSTQEIVPDSVTRGRGRPSKVSNEYRVSSPVLDPPRTEESTDMHIASTSTQEIVQDSVKRGRGRPSKVSNECRVSSPLLDPPRTEESTGIRIASTSTQEIVQDSVKRGRGRPKKYPKEDGDESPKIKRPRGRPRKNSGPGVSPVRSTLPEVGTEQSQQQPSGSLSGPKPGEYRIGLVLEGLKVDVPGSSEMKDNEVSEIQDEEREKTNQGVQGKGGSCKSKTPSDDASDIYGFDDNVEKKKVPSASSRLQMHSPTSQRKILFKGGNLKIQSVNIKPKKSSPNPVVSPVASVYDFDDDDDDDIFENQTRDLFANQETEENINVILDKEKLGQGRLADIEGAGFLHGGNEPEDFAVHLPISTSNPTGVEADEIFQEKQDIEVGKDQKLSYNHSQDEPSSKIECGDVQEVEDDFESDATIENYFQGDDPHAGMKRSENQDGMCVVNQLISKETAKNKDAAGHMQRENKEKESEDEDVDSFGVIEPDLEDGDVEDQTPNFNVAGISSPKPTNQSDQKTTNFQETGVANEKTRKDGGNIDDGAIQDISDDLLDDNAIESDTGTEEYDHEGCDGTGKDHVAMESQEKSEEVTNVPSDDDLGDQNQGQSSKNGFGRAEVWRQDSPTASPSDVLNFATPDGGDDSEEELDDKLLEEEEDEMVPLSTSGGNVAPKNMEEDNDNLDTGDKCQDDEVELLDDDDTSASSRPGMQKGEGPCQLTEAGEQAEGSKAGAIDKDDVAPIEYEDISPPVSPETQKGMGGSKQSEVEGGEDERLEGDAPMQDEYISVSETPLTQDGCRNIQGETECVDEQEKQVERISDDGDDVALLQDSEKSASASGKPQDGCAESRQAVESNKEVEDDSDDDDGSMSIPDEMECDDIDYSDADMDCFEIGDD